MIQVGGMLYALPALSANVAVVSITMHNRTNATRSSEGEGQKCHAILKEPQFWCEMLRHPAPMQIGH